MTAPLAPPIISAPTFPLSPSELLRWDRFGRKGGLGTAVAMKDCEQDAPENLMMLQGDQVVILLELGEHMYLGWCEGIIGHLKCDTVKLTTKLKRPVARPRPSPAATTAPRSSPPVVSDPSPNPPAPLATPPATETTGSEPKDASQVDLEMLADGLDLTSANDARMRRRRTNVAGLGIQVKGVLPPSPPVPQVRPQQRVQSIFWREDASSSTSSPASTLPPSPMSPALAGAFVGAPSPALSSTSTVVSSTYTDATPSMITSPSSESEDSHVVTPPPSGWTEPRIQVRNVSPPLAPSFAPSRLNNTSFSPHSSDEPTDKFPSTIDRFPLPLPRDFASTSSPSEPHSPVSHTPPPQSPVSAPPPPQPSQHQILRSQFSDASLATSKSSYKISDGPSLDDHPLPFPIVNGNLPSTFSSPSSTLFSRLPKSSDASWNSDGGRDGGGFASGPSTPGNGAGGEDQTLAFIYAAYENRHSSDSVHTMLGGAGSGNHTPSRLLAGLSSTGEEDVVNVGALGVAREEEEEVLDRMDYNGESEEEIEKRLDRLYDRGMEQQRHVPAPAPAFGFGAASQLRGRMEMEKTLPRTIPQVEHKLVPRESIDSMAGIPRLSTLFPRSSTADSLASIQTLPLEEELDASRQLFYAHFNPASAPLSSSSPSQPSELNTLADPLVHTLPSATANRRKSVKGLQISSPVVPSPSSIPSWRSPTNSSPTASTSMHHATAPAHDDVFSSPSQRLPPSPPGPSLTIQGAVPTPPTRSYDRTYYDDPNPPQLNGGWMPKLTQASLDGAPAQYALGPASSGPSTPTTPLFANADCSAPSTPPPYGRRERQRSESGSLRERENSQTNKLRKPNLRLRTSSTDTAQSSSMTSAPTVASNSRFFASPQSATYPPASASVSSPPPFFTSPPPPRSPGRLVHKASKNLLPFSRSKTNSNSTNEKLSFVAGHHGGGISNKDFEDETVKLQKVEFEMIKPLRDHIGMEEELRSPISIDGATTESGHRPSLATTRTKSSDDQSCDDHTFDTALSPTVTRVPVPLDEQGIENHRAKELKWIRAMDSMSVGSMKKNKKMRGLIQTGVPASVRGRVWQFLAEVDSVKKAGVYQSLCKGDRIPIDEEIEQDLAFTLRDHPHFAPSTDAVGRDELGSVLKALARYHADLGYSPAMGILAVVLLSQLGDGELTFWCLVSLIASCNFRNFFPASHAALRVETLAFGFVLESAMPKVAKRFLELGIDPSLFYRRWMSCAFSTVLPPSSTLRVFDLILFDPSYKLKIALSILENSHFDDPQLFPDSQSIISYLQRLPSSSFIPTLLMPTVYTIKLSDSQVKKAYKRAESVIRKTVSGTMAHK